MRERRVKEARLRIELMLGDIIRKRIDRILQSGRGYVYRSKECKMELPEKYSKRDRVSTLIDYIEKYKDFGIRIITKNQEDYRKAYNKYLLPQEDYERIETFNEISPVKYISINSKEDKIVNIIGKFSKIEGINFPYKGSLAIFLEGSSIAKISCNEEDSYNCDEGRMELYVFDLLYKLEKPGYLSGKLDYSFEKVHVILKVSEGEILCAYFLSLDRGIGKIRFRNIRLDEYDYFKLDKGLEIEAIRVEAYNNEGVIQEDIKGILDSNEGRYLLIIIEGIGRVAGLIKESDKESAKTLYKFINTFISNGHLNV